MKLPGEVVSARQKGIAETRWYRWVLEVQRAAEVAASAGACLAETGSEGQAASDWSVLPGKFQPISIFYDLAETLSQGDGRALAQPGARHLGCRIE